MSRKRTSPPPLDYFTALQRIFALQTEVLTAVLPHVGERGRNDEERFRDFLRRSLPRRFSLGTGFLVSSDPSISPSSQTDIVIYDEFQNSPLHRELAAFVYPIEIVYAILEVKGLFKSSDLKKCFADIAKVRALAKAKRYIRHVAVPIDADDPSKAVLGHVEIPDTLSPRAYIVAYDIQGYASLDSFAAACRRALLRNKGAHLHGIAVLSRDWFLYQLAYQENEVKLEAFSGNALARLIGKLIDEISGMQMLPASMHRYLHLDKCL